MASSQNLYDPERIKHEVAIDKVSAELMRVARL